MKSVIAVAALGISMAVGFGQRTSDPVEKYRKDLEANPRSSLAHFRIGEILGQQGNYQAAANEFRSALSGDLQPRWTEVWAHINLGKIFDITNQRARAVNEYQLAAGTGDNTQGALTEADRAALPVALHLSQTSCRLRQRVRHGAPLGTREVNPIVHGREKTTG